jgi:predicted TIM-barrel fold metal-dependent hydrolase
MNPLIVDAHAHLGAWPRFSVVDGSPDAALQLMDYLGISHTIVSHHLGLVGMLSEAERLSREAFERSQGRILSYLVFDPHRAQESLDIIVRCCGEPFFAGVKLHPALHCCPADDVRYAPVWELADERKLVVLIHTWDRSIENPVQNYSFPDLLEGFIKATSGATVLLGHAGGHYDGFLAAARLAAAYPNVYLDLTGDDFARGRVEYFVQHVSSSRVLFGSDMPWIDPRFPLGEVLAADITYADRAAILGENAVRIFSLEDNK